MNNKRIIILLILVIITIFLIIFFIIKPGFLEIKNLSQQIENEKKSLEELYSRGETLSKIKNEYKKIEKDISLLDNVFLTEGKELEFITSLEKIAQGQKVRQDVNIGMTKILKENYKLIPIQLRLRGNFLDLIKYLRELEKLDFYLNIDSLSITPLPGLEKQIEISLSANTYWREEK